MDPLRIVLRVVVVFVVLLVLVRMSGKRTVRQGSPFDFAIALILGDMVDDAIWAEVAASQFIVACGVLVSVHVLTDFVRFRSGSFR
jgi:uncharacterized membrane protein YcaP (DUF421 family)